MNKYCTKIEDIPKCEHWAIITNASVHVPGDERSRTAPGHGYPAYTTHHLSYCAYMNEEDFRVDVLTMANAKLRGQFQPSFEAIHVKGRYDTTVSITLQKV